MRIALLTSFLVFSLLLSAQVPQGIKYQAVARSSQGQVVTNQIIGLEIAILQGGPNGQVTYTETHRPTTNEFGLFTIVIGEGTAILGTFSNIEWSLGEYFVRTSLDINGGNNYAFMGTSQLLSVPYALYAERTSKSDNDFDQDSTNELQTLDLTGTTLSISNGNSVQLGGTVDLDGDPTNEIQQLSINGTQLNLSNGGGSVTLPADNDSDPNNEIQTISSSATGTERTITLSQSNAITIDVADNDDDANNELQDLSSAKAGNEVTIDISNGVGTTINVDDDDADPENELQQLQLSGDTIRLSQNGGSVVVPSDIPIGGCILSLDTTSIDGYTYSGVEVRSKGNLEVKYLGQVPNGLDYTSYSVGIANDKIIVLSRHLEDNYLYDPESNTWQSSIDTPTSRYGYAISSVNNNTYVFGGDLAQNLIERFDLVSNRWTQAGTLPLTQPTPSCACSYKDSIFLIGSSNNSIALNLFIPSTGSFISKPSRVLSTFYNSSCVVLDDILYVFTGRQICSFNISSNTWDNCFTTIYPAEFGEPVSGLLRPFVTTYNNNIIVSNFSKARISISNNAVTAGINSSVVAWNPVINTWQDSNFFIPTPSASSWGSNEIINHKGKVYLFTRGKVFLVEMPTSLYLHCK